MANPKIVRFNDEQRVKAFILRARRILSHSLWRDQRELMESNRIGRMTINVTVNRKTGEESYVSREEYPNEELLESLAARLRPLTLRGDNLHYSEVLNSIESLVPASKFPEYVEPIEEWRKMWAGVATRDASAQAYSIITDRGTASDQDLMYAWFYGDIVHADDKEEQAKGLGIDARYKAAAGIVARMVECTELTFLLIQTLVNESILTVDPELFERDVVATKSVFETKQQIFLSEVGGPPVTNTEIPNPEVWQSLAASMAPHVRQQDPCELWIEQRRTTEQPGV
ncbi:MAG: hypothetical protein EOP31_26505 [Rhodococcus sp. (in: high G+C Gram-positive bacteria)]|uniref:hypothetical protein n=1 Tax=Rhodococcus sp. TaxID=1831 RepID=UPI00121C2B81|nr:hypothetical protein [Rhodococcus sp. (in: high G+C Gram-positive bacteria)]RZL21836.1 MAG: hypothetical protein EOP31_26505 [Rhodococcus sp. (in: high G+C Gram-positive bacteria)]